MDLRPSEQGVTEAAIKQTFLSIGIMDHTFFTYSEVTDIEAINLSTSCSSLEFCYTLYSISELYIVFSVFYLHYGCSDLQGGKKEDIYSDIKRKKCASSLRYKLVGMSVIFCDIKPQALLEDTL